MNREKSSLRRSLLEKRRAMPPEQVRAAGRVIAERLDTLPEYAAAEAVFTYVSSKDNEVDTHGLIERALAQGRLVGVPIAGPRRRLVWSRLNTLDELAPGRFGILEPLTAFRRPIHPGSRDVVLVPGIGFTPEGGRIGYGGGYFDRFLRGFTGTSIALAYTIQMVASFPCCAHDVPVDIVVTELAVYRRGSPRHGS